MLSSLGHGLPVPRGLMSSLGRVAADSVSLRCRDSLGALVVFSAMGSLLACTPEDVGDGCDLVAGDLVFSEVMADPVDDDRGREWFEMVDYCAHAAINPRFLQPVDVYVTGRFGRDITRLEPREYPPLEWSTVFIHFKARRWERPVLHIEYTDQLSGP